MAISNKVTIEIAGNKIPDFIHLTIDQTIHQPHDFQLVCRKDILEKSGDSTLSSTIKKIGSVLTVSIEGINSGGDTKDFYFKGIITDISLSGSMSKEEITFTGHSPDILLQGYPTSCSFDNMSIKQIAEEIIRPYPQDQISLTGDPMTDSQYPYIVQYRETNYEFLRRLSTRMGEWFFYNGQKLVLGDYQRKSSKGTLGLNLSNLSIGTRIVPLKFKLRSYYYHLYGQAENKSENLDISNSLNTIGKQVQDQSLKSYPEESVNYLPVEFIKDDGSEISGKSKPSSVAREKQMLASGMVMVTGTCDEPLVPGNVLKIKTLNNSQNEVDFGDYLITAIHHTIDNSMNYQNNFSGIPAETKISPDTSMFATRSCESQTAFVTDNNDPQKWGRVRVRFYWQKEGQSTPWIRSVNVYGGESYGSYFVPEKDSEVLVGFEGGNVQKPYVIGPMINSQWKPDDKWVTQSNDFKIIKTRSGHIIKFNDTKGSGKITIQAQGDIELVGNNIKLTAQDGIEINGGNKIKIISDQGNIQVLSQDTNTLLDHAGFTISVNDSFSLTQGLNQLTMSSDGVALSGSKTEISSSSETKLGADAVVEINGAIVKIN